MNPRYPTIAHRAGHRCEYCRAPEVAFNFAFEIEHIEPTAHGGLKDDSNLALACRVCNIHKSDETTGFDPLTNERVPLFHPRRDRWTEHFAIDPESAIIGKTPAGRATVITLHMNSPRQIVARQQWRTLRIFP